MWQYCSLEGNRVFLAIFAASLGVLRGKGLKNPDREARKVIAMCERTANCTPTQILGGAEL
jgi:hypothetical protein